MSVRALPTLSEVQALRAGTPNPKGKSRLEEKMAKKKQADRMWEDCKRAVWVRDDGKCRLCARKVVKSLELKPNRGDVHHRKGRNVAPENRYKLSELVLLCAVCHGKAQRHEVRIPR